MVVLKRLGLSKKEREESDDALGEPMGSPTGDKREPSIHLDHHHLEKLGVEELPEVGREIEFHGKGRVEDTHESDGSGGKQRRMTIRLHHGSLEGHEATEARDSELRGELEKNTRASDDKASKREEAKDKSRGGKGTY